MVYRPTARVLTILELLQSHGCMTGAELARWLEVDIPFIIHHPFELHDVVHQYALALAGYARRWDDSYVKG